jgi:hypothetical protein
MSESLVDLSYRGLALGKRIKLTQVRPTAGFLEMPIPMPVGTTIGIATDDGVLLEATVAEVHEQVTGTERAPGMMVKPKLDADAARAWWKERVSIAEEKAAPPADTEGKVTVRSRRMSEGGVPELVDDGRNTAVMEVMDDAAAAAAVSDTPPEEQATIIDDGKRTMMMDAIDLEALGLDPAASSGSMSTVTDEDSGPTSGKKKKKKKR